MIRHFTSPASSDRLAAAADFIRSFPAGTEIFVVAQHRTAADDLVRSLAMRQIATFGLHRFSLMQLAFRLAAGDLATRKLTPASWLAAQATAAHVAFKLKLPYLDPVTKYPGFAPSAADTLRELRLAGVKAVPGDIGAMLAEYDITDAATIYEIAKTKKITHPILLLDVRPQSKAERDFVNALTDGFATEHGGERKGKTSLDRLRANLFSQEALPKADFDDSVVFFSAPGEGREAVEIARAILRHARDGTPFDRMAIFLRSPAKYQAHLESAFDRAGIPAYFARGSRRPDPAGRALLALLACAADGLSARRFAEYLSLGQVPDAPSHRWMPPESHGDLIDDSMLAEEPPNEDGTLREPYRWEALLVEAAVLGGKDRWERRLRGLDAELRRKLAELTSEEPESGRIQFFESQLERLGHLREFAMPIIERLDALQRCKSWRDWLDALRELAGATLRRPDRVLEVLAELEPMAGVGPVGVGEVRVTLAERLSSLELRPPKRRFGRVFVAPIEQALGRTFEVVFVPGLVERGFPQKIREDPLLLDDARRAVSSDLETSDERSSDERRMLHDAVGAAEKFLYASYPRVDVAQGRSRVASFYALDVIRAVTGRIPNHVELERQATQRVGARLAWPAPSDPGNAIDDLEHDLAVLDPRLRPAEPGRARYLLELNPFLGRSLRARYSRWERQRWNEYDGITRATDGIRAALAANSLRIRPYSASSLQRYAACPHQFFLSAIVRLEPREEPEPPVRLDALTRGSMIHEMHALTLRRLKKKNLLPLRMDHIDAAEEVLHGVVDEVAARWEEDLAPAIPRVWSDEIALIRTDLRLWLREIASEAEEWIAEHCELAFGLRRSDDYDEESVRDPVRLPGDWLLHGSVDLIERRVVFGDLRVSDYKTGSKSARDEAIVGGGEILQPLLYALAVEKIFGGDVSVSRLFYSTSRGGFAKVDIDIMPSTRDAIGRVLGQIEEAVASGFLPPAPKVETWGRKHTACDWCDFRPVCGPYEAIRLTRKNPIPELEMLRNEK